MIIILICTEKSFHWNKNRAKTKNHRKYSASETVERTFRFLMIYFNWNFWLITFMLAIFDCMAMKLSFQMKINDATKKKHNKNQRSGLFE